MLLRQCETWSQGDFSVVTGFSGLQWKLAESGVCVRKLQISHYFQQSQGFWNSKFSLTKYFTCWDACKCTFNPNLIVLQNDFIFVSDLDLTLPSFFIVEYHLRKKSSFLCLHILLDIQCSYLLWVFLAIIVIFLPHCLFICRESDLWWVFCILCRTEVFSITEQSKYNWITISENIVWVNNISI